jgi:tetratricopeptide (TPR) repeat protein
VRPRVVSNQKPVGAAQAALRVSASVGEQHLTNLLSAGLLDIPNVRVAPVDYHVGISRRWRRSASGLLITLFILALIGGGAVFGWNWYLDSVKEHAAAQSLARVDKALDSATPEALRTASTDVTDAIEQDPQNTAAPPRLAELLSLRALLYGDVELDQVENAVRRISATASEADPSYRAAVVAKAALPLSSWNAGKGRAEEVLAARAALEKWLSGHKDDHLSRWLLGEVQLASGARSAARASFEQAHASGKGSVLATVRLADWWLDEGDFDAALRLYDEALKRVPQQVLAFAGRAMARVERGDELQAPMEDLSVHLAKVKGRRIEAIRALGLAEVWYVSEDWGKLASDLELARGLSEPRFLARIALHRLRQGRFDQAANARQRVRWADKKPESDPLVRVFDGELAWVRGDADAALKLVGHANDLRSRMLRGKALFDLDQFSAARAEFEGALRIAPEVRWLKAWTYALRILVPSNPQEAQQARSDLRSLRSGSSNMALHLLLGEALLRDDPEGARREVEKAIEDHSQETPNPLLHRSRVVLAELKLLEGKTREALELADAALKEIPNYLPAERVFCCALAISASPDARGKCKVLVETGKANAAVELAWARILASSDRFEAMQAVRRAKKKGATDAALQDVIPIVDDKLFDELGVPKRHR